MFLGRLLEQDPIGYIGKWITNRISELHLLRNIDRRLLLPNAVKTHLQDSFYARTEYLQGGLYFPSISWGPGKRLVKTQPLPLRCLVPHLCVTARGYILAKLKCWLLQYSGFSELASPSLRILSWFAIGKQQRDPTSVRFLRNVPPAPN